MPITSIDEKDFYDYLDLNPDLEKSPFSPGGLTIIIYYHPAGTTWREWSIRRAIRANINEDEKLKKSEEFFEQRT